MFEIGDKVIIELPDRYPQDVMAMSWDGAIMNGGVANNYVGRTKKGDVAMRLGPKEKEILSRLRPGEWTPPSVYLGDYGRCSSQHPSGRSVSRLVEKGLVVFRYQEMTPKERLEVCKRLKPGRQASEFNGALKLTAAAEMLISVGVAA